MAVIEVGGWPRSRLPFYPYPPSSLSLSLSLPFRWKDGRKEGGVGDERYERGKREGGREGEREGKERGNK
jgi:hypothetical protein